jgi:predicted LPLAT superfamily acyltransferase
MQERGSILGIRIVLFTLRMLGCTAASLLLVPIIAYFFVTGKTSRRASLGYLAKLHRTDPRAPQPTLWQAYRHHLEFALTVLERMLLWQGRLKGFHFDSVESERALLNRKGTMGSLLLGSHLGSFDALRALALSVDNRVHVVMYRAHAKRINQVMEELSGQTNLRVVELAPGDMNGVLDLKDCVDRGEHVALLADRHAPGGKERICRVPFLGEPAAFPQSPWILASLLECPVVMVAGLRLKRMSYRITVTPMADRVVLSRKDREAQARPHIEKFARRLEELCCDSPRQWFNFYDFWQRNE